MCDTEKTDFYVMKENAESLIDFISEAPTAYHAVNVISKKLEDKFKKLEIGEDWDIALGGSYYITQNDSTIISFSLPKELDLSKVNFKIIGSHTDSPSIKIKPNSEIFTSGYLQLNTEVYGSPILSTWFDRSLSLAGRVLIKSDNSFVPKMKLINIKKPLAIIPNLAIHMNRTINNGHDINFQKELLPIIAAFSKNPSDKDILLTLVSENINVEKEKILDFELFLYDTQKGSLIGISDEFITSSRVDDLQACHAGLKAITSSESNTDTINMLACFDNEEVGSSSKQGADSQFLSNTIERIIYSISGTRSDFLKAISKSFFISLDGAHSMHPSFIEKSDVTNRPVINKGIVVKISSNQRYTSDSESFAIFKNIAHSAKIPYQTFVNNSNEKGGSTIGPISSSHIEFKSIDIGIPMLGMHSIRETCGVYDHTHCIQFLKNFYNCKA